MRPTPDLGRVRRSTSLVRWERLGFWHPEPCPARWTSDYVSRRRRPVVSGGAWWSRQWLDDGDRRRRCFRSAPAAPTDVRQPAREADRLDFPLKPKRGASAMLRLGHETDGFQF